MTKNKPQGMNLLHLLIKILKNLLFLKYKPNFVNIFGSRVSWLIREILDS